MFSFGETRSTWFKCLPNWGRFNNRDQLNPGTKKKERKKEKKPNKKTQQPPKNKGGGEQAANPLLPSLPRPGLAHTICCSLKAAAGGGVRRGRDALTHTHTHTRTRTHPHAPRTIVPARPPRSLSLSLGVFCWRPGRGPARPPAPRRSGAAHSLSAGGRFQTAAIAAPLFAGRVGSAPLCARRPRLAGAGRSAAVTAREAHSSVHLGVGLRILLATREISPFSPCLQYGYKSGIFYYFFFTKLGLLFFFFFARLFPPFFPLPPVLLLFDLFNFKFFKRSAL